MEVLEERMEALDRGKNQSYTFLGCHQSDKINVEKVMPRVRAEMARRAKQLVEQQKNLIKAVNTRVIPVAPYVMNVCNLNEKQLDELDTLIINKCGEIMACLDDKAAVIN